MLRYSRATVDNINPVCVRHSRQLLLSFSRPVHPALPADWISANFYRSVSLSKSAGVFKEIYKHLLNLLRLEKKWLSRRNNLYAEFNVFVLEQWTNIVDCSANAVLDIATYQPWYSLKPALYKQLEGARGQPS
jgi:hypothetical protein